MVSENDMPDAPSDSATRHGNATWPAVQLEAVNGDQLSVAAFLPQRLASVRSRNAKSAAALCPKATYEA